MKTIIVTVLSIITFSFNIFSSGGNDISWYKYMEGFIGKYPVIMHMHKSDKSIRGYYYYEKFRQPIGFFGDVIGDSVMLITSSNNSGESFRGILKKNSYKGEWKNGENSSFDFNFEEDAAASSMFEYVYVHGAKQVFKGWDKSPQGEYTETCFWPSGKYSSVNFIRESICLEKKFPGGSKAIGEHMLNSKNKFLEGYIAENRDLDKAEIEKSDNSYMYSVTDEDNMIISYYDDNLFVISRMYYSYTGGAHGNYGTGFTVYDLVNKKKLSVPDILTGDGIKTMPAILEKNFRKQYVVDEKMSLQDYGLFVDTIPVNDNFTFTPGGMSFNYVPYEISPYAGGEIMIYVPIEDIEKFLQPEAKKLIR